jgi:hypothetical protein
MLFIRIKKSIAGKGFSFGSGTETRLPAKFAQSLINAGQAEIIEEDGVQTKDSPSKRADNVGRSKSTPKGERKRRRQPNQ